MNITTDMLQALENQIAFLQGMILNSVNDKVSTDEFKKQKTQLELLLEECEKTEIKTEINSINLDEKIDPIMVEWQLSKLVHQGLITNNDCSNTVKKFTYKRYDEVGYKNIYEQYTWRIFYETFYHQETRLASKLGKNGKRCSIAILLLLKELGLPELIE